MDYKFNINLFLCMQPDEYDDVIEAVNTYVLTSDPPLVPVLHGKSFETQVSITDAPPEYDKANKVLKVHVIMCTSLCIQVHSQWDICEKSVYSIYPSPSPQPDIAPLPDIGRIKIADKTAQEGQPLCDMVVWGQLFVICKFRSTEITPKLSTHQIICPV